VAIGDRESSFAGELLLPRESNDLYIAAPSQHFKSSQDTNRDFPMARQCEACGKKVQMGNRVETRGKAKYLGGVGTKITGITRRKFVPNLQKVHVTLRNGENKSMRVCVQCIRSGVVRKTVKIKPFDVTGGKKN
jgi:large subunit ribosomal protein L28